MRNIYPDIYLLSIAIYCYLLLSIDIYRISIRYLLLSIGYLSDIYCYLSDIYRISIGYLFDFCRRNIDVSRSSTASSVLFGELFGCLDLVKPKLLQLAMSAQSIAETQPDDTVFPCIKCGLDCSAKDSAVLRGANWQCKSCTNVYQILYRHMGGLPESWNNMTPESQVQFFKHAGSAIKCAPKNGRWSHVRSSLVSQMTHFHREQRRIRCNREFLPLSVWATRGFDTKRIEANGEMREDKALWRLVCSTLGHT